MATISLDSLSFYYDAPYTPVFSDLTLSIDAAWRTGLVGRNGKGKTTLLRLLHGELQPCSGTLRVPCPVGVFPPQMPDTDEEMRDGGCKMRDARSVIKACVAPFEEWERELDALSAQTDSFDAKRHSELLETYEHAGGYTIDAAIEKEAADIGLPARVLDQPFDTLSGGEQTRALITAMFLRSGEYPLIDEPTNHLDREGRAALGKYLSRKDGFLLVSHDRALLEQCVDHVLSLNRADVRLQPCRFSEWYAQMQRERAQEEQRKTELKKEVRSLRVAAQRRRQWSDNKEREKQGTYDKGFVGHRAAKQMKRALSIEARVTDKLHEKEQLLRNIDKERTLKLTEAERTPEQLLRLEHLSVELGGRAVLQDISFTVNAGERVAVTGPNGCGKTTLLRAIAGELPLAAGSVHLPRRVQVLRAYQQPLWQEGLLRDHIRAAGIDETLIRTVLGTLGVSGDVFDRPLETFSEGERKKVDLSRSFLEPGHLLLWDEPMNYIDLLSREQIEEVVLAHEPTMLFVEHDRWFVERVATRELALE
jgi:lincosamide and streptogramin A transport system ATP-binding/permease protein